MYSDREPYFILRIDSTRNILDLHSKIVLFKKNKDHYKKMRFIRLDPQF